MFQNISKQEENVFGEDVKNGDYENSRKTILRRTFSLQNCIIYVLSFMVSMAGGESTLLSAMPFGYAIIAAAIGAEVPVIGVIIASLIGTIVGNGTTYLVAYILTILLFVALVLIKRPKEIIQEIEPNEARKVGIHMSIAVLVVQIVQMLFKTIYVYDILYSVMLSISTYVIYKIFVNSLIVFKEFTIKKVFSIEEVIGAGILLAVAISAIGQASILGFSIRNILSILIVLVLGWKNGMLIGATGGLTIGLTLGIIQGENPAFIAAYAISGCVAGILNRFGKTGVILGFILGNIILSYISNGNTSNIIRVQEILIAALGLLAMPKASGLKVSDLIEKNKLLPETTGRTLEENKATVNKLNNMSETIAQIAKEYTVPEIAYVKNQDDNYNQEIFEAELKATLENQEENLLYDAIYNNDDDVLTELFEILNEKNVITKKDIIQTFALHNNYIMGCAVGGDETEITVSKDLDDMVRFINSSYRISKLNFVWKKKMKENKKKVSTQLEGVSEAISNLATDIKIDEEDKYKIQKSQIKAFMDEKEIELKEITVKQDDTGRYIISLYTTVCKSVDGKDCFAKKIANILTKVFSEGVTLQKQKCGLRENDNTCVFTYTSADKYGMQVGISKTKKSESIISGDTTTQTRLEDGKYLIALSDGMGSGPDARKSSKIAIKMLERLLESGFNKDVALKLINSIVSNNIEEDTYATLDVNILDLFSGNMNFFKNGACPTFLKRNNNVEILKSVSLPAGILENIDLVEYNQKLQDGDIILMCSDGVIESNKEYINKELWIKYILEELETDDAQRIADIVLKEAIDNDFGQEKDDMTVIACKISKR